MDWISIAICLTVMYETVTSASKPWCYPLPGGPEKVTLKKRCSMVN